MCIIIGVNYLLISNFLSQIIFIIAVSFFTICLVVFLITLIVSINNSKKFERTMTESSNSLRVYIVDIKEDNVLFFNRATIRNKRESSVTEFYNQFPASEREKLIEWIGRLVDPNDNPPQYLEIDVMISKLQKKYHSLLQVQKIDHKRQVVHLESYILKNSALRANKRKIKYAPSSEEKIAKALLSNPANRGVTYAFSFYQKRAKQDSDNMNRFAIAKIKELITQCLNAYRLLLIYSDTQFIIFDLHVSSRAHAVMFVNSMRQEIGRFLMLNSLTDSIDFTVGMVENKVFPQDYEELIKSSINVADIAKEDNEKIMWYEQGMRSIELGENEYRSEVERIIRDKKLRFYFRPVYNAERKKTLGYFSFVKPVDTFFDSISELKDYAFRTEDDKELFATIATNVISRFNAQKDGDSLRLFFPIKIAEKPHIIKSLSHVSKIKETHLVLSLDSSDIQNYDGSEDNLINDIRTFRVKGYEVALFISDRELSMSSRIYELFDYFIINSGMTQNLKNSSRARVQIHGLIEKLLSYDHPIIVSDLPNWNSVELMLKIGVTLVSGEVIAASDEMILPIPPKSVNKIKTML